MLPTLDETKKLYAFFQEKMLITDAAIDELPGTSAKHTENVAFIASRIAEAAGMDATKAYILGLFHDCGDYIEKTVKGTFHGTAGYDLMMEKGFDEVAKVCLSHSFCTADFNFDDFAAYERKELVRAKKLLQTMPLDDYDRLVYLADKMSPHDYIDTIEHRVEMIRNRYHLSDKRASELLKETKDVKDYFDQKCGQDVYKILNLV
jgi:HD superfamily phosphohydrolase YqeK